MVVSIGKAVEKGGVGDWRLQDREKQKYQDDMLLLEATSPASMKRITSRTRYQALIYMGCIFVLSVHLVVPSCGQGGPTRRRNGFRSRRLFLYQSILR